MKLEGKRSELFVTDDLYPAPLKTTARAPERLFVIGDAGVLQNEGIAIIGARKASNYGMMCAGHFAETLVNRNITLVNGGAHGCDTAALRACIAKGGRAIVVLAGGCDKIYPVDNADLFQQVINCGGAVISEHVWDASPKRYQFRERNRITAGLSKAVLVTEAALPSGTFSTCDAALEADREVWAIPGNIDSPQSTGSNKLIYQGATPIIDDVVFIDQLSAVFPNP